MTELDPVRVAREAAAEVICAGVGCLDEARRQILAGEWDRDPRVEKIILGARAMQAAGAGVRVKALEWNPFRAETPWGYYQIDDCTGDDLKGRPPFLLSGRWVDNSRHATLHDARAAAQAHHDRLVLSTLSPAGPQEGATFDPALSPGMTDMMVPPEANPLPPTPAPAADVAGLVEQIAQWLHDEVEYPDPNFPHYHWPEHPDDTGQREGGWLNILPKDIQEQFRDIARRLATFIDRKTASTIEALQAEVARKDARIAEYEEHRQKLHAARAASEARATAAEAEAAAWRERESETQEALQKIGEEFGIHGGEPRVDGLLRVLRELRAEAAALRAEVERKDKALREAGGAIAEYFRYLNGGETRGSYDGKPEREGLRKAGYAVSRALAPAKAGG